MSIVVAYAAYFFGFVEAALELGAVYFAYRLTRLAGAFRAWVLIIAALIILASHSVAELFQLATEFPFQQLDLITGSVSIVSFVLSSMSGVLLSALLFAAMFELYRKFRQFSR
ncbi:MAG TPA: hypothetical protein VGR53_09185 [Nitrososphaerales archaeon]|nr:hypothetical protein [Nitrososphaerales archaeon]